MKKLFLFLSIVLYSVTSNGQTNFATLTLTASKAYSPSKWTDDSRLFSERKMFKIPAGLNVTTGNAGNYIAVLEFETNNKKIRITYRGGSNQSHPTDSIQVMKGKKYLFFHSSDKHLGPGDLIRAEGIRLHIINGDNQAGLTVVEAPIPLALTITYNVSRCPGGPTTFTMCTSDQPTQAKWNNTYIGTIFTSASCGFQSQVTTPIEVLPNYTLFVNFANGSTYSTTVTTSTLSTAPLTPVLSAIPNPLCPGLPVTLKANATALTTFTWSGPNLTSTVGTTVTANPIVTSTYTAIATWTLNQCRSTASIPVIVTPLALNIISSGNNCPGNTITLTASGATSYSWSGPAIVGPNNTATITVTVPFSGTDIYTVTGTSGTCTGTATQQVRRRGLSPEWATYFGGVNCEQVLGVVTDAAGFIYIAGSTDGISKTLPVTSGTIIKATGPMGSATYGQSSCFNDIYVSKISSDGKIVYWTHYIGGSDAEGVIDFVHDNGHVYVVAGTISNDFPITTGPAYKGNGDGYCAKFNASTGDMEWATYIGSPSRENSEGVTVVGNTVFVAGTINGPGLINATNAAFGQDDIYLAKLDNATGAVLLSTYFGGDNCFDCCFGMDRDASGNPIVIGFSNGLINPSFLAPGLEQTNGFAPNFLHGGFDALCMKYDQNLNIQKWTKIGGIATEDFEGVRVSGNYIYAAGWSSSNTANPADYNAAVYNRIGTNVYGNRDMFMAKLNLSDLSVNMTRFYGGSGDEEAVDVEVENGEVYVSGSSTSSNIFAANPPATPFYRNYTGQVPGSDQNMFVGRFNANTFVVDWQTHYANNAAGLFGSTDNIGIALDNAHNLIMVGSTTSNDFEWVAPFAGVAIQNVLNGGTNYDGVIVKLSCNTVIPCTNCKTATSNNSNMGNATIQASEELALKIYPNPFTNEVNIVISGKGSYDVKIINSIGETSFEKTNVSTDEIQTLGNDLQAGIYFIKVTGNDKSYSGKIIKTK